MGQGLGFKSGDVVTGVKTRRAIGAHGAKEMIG